MPSQHPYESRAQKKVREEAEINTREHPKQQGRNTVNTEAKPAASNSRYKKQIT